MEIMLFNWAMILAQNASVSGPSPWMILVGGLLTSGVITAALNFYFNRNKTSSETEKIDADAADIIQRAAGELIVKVQEQAAASQLHFRDENRKLLEQNGELMKELMLLKTQTNKIPELQFQINELSNGVAALIRQLKQHEIHPVYIPPEFKQDLPL